MKNSKPILITLAALATAATLALAQETAPKTNSPPDAKTGTNVVRKAAAKQADVASKTATFGKVSKTDDAYKTALDAHALADALKQVDKDGAFKGTVAKVFEPRGGAMAILNFDDNYRNALTALLKKDEFDKFPALTNLLAKEVVVTGKFVDYQGRAEIVLTNAAQVKLVE
ncbi:MAG TPA: hypothetical protein VK731_07430 [Candidatus Cybelea sp.]|jgi:hypothetical protein|nr:hypothetical protein [Candidatus Cybelea sp.]